MSKLKFLYGAILASAVASFNVGAQDLTSSDGMKQKIFGSILSSGKTKAGSVALPGQKDYLVPLSKTIDGITFSQKISTPNVLGVKSFIVFGQTPTATAADIKDILAEATATCTEANGRIAYSASLPRSQSPLATQLMGMLQKDKLLGLHTCLTEQSEPVFHIWVEPSPDVEMTFLPPGNNWNVYFSLVDQKGINTFDSKAKDYVANILATRSEFSTQTEDFRSSIKIGTPAAIKSERYNGRYDCALVIEVKDPLVQIQTSGKTTYVEKGTVFPPVYQAPAPRNSLNYKCDR